MSKTSEGHEWSKTKLGVAIASVVFIVMAGFCWLFSGPSRAARRALAPATSLSTNRFAFLAARKISVGSVKIDILNYLQNLGCIIVYLMFTSKCI